MVEKTTNSTPNISNGSSIVHRTPSIEFLYRILRSVIAKLNNKDDLTDSDVESDEENVSEIEPELPQSQIIEYNEDSGKETETETETDNDSYNSNSDEETDNQMDAVNELDTDSSDEESDENV